MTQKRTPRSLAVPQSVQLGADGGGAGAPGRASLRLVNDTSGAAGLARDAGAGGWPTTTGTAAVAASGDVGAAVPVADPDVATGASL
ncbi:MAG TPA: hypothetical protein VN894_00320 [Polyangiaceae bacterium]|nr:hypothetical protein [Polyangiaceae bacterium]